MEPPADAVWTSTSKPLPVETGDYRLELPKIGWTVMGTQASGNISILIPGNRLGTIRPERYNLLAQLKEFILRHPARPENHKLKYELREYGSLKPYPVIGLE
jgi:hypothetical protein